MLHLTISMISQTKVDTHTKITHYRIPFIASAKTSKIIFGVRSQDSGYLWENNN